jgi:hypothetical protein
MVLTFLSLASCPHPPAANLICRMSEKPTGPFLAAKEANGMAKVRHPAVGTDQASMPRTAQLQPEAECVQAAVPV